MKKQLIWFWVLMLLFSPSLWAQDKNEHSAESKTTAQADDLELDDDDELSIEDQLAQLRRDHGRIVRKFGRKLRAAESGDRAELTKEKNSLVNEIATQAFALVAIAESDDQRVDVLRYIVSVSTGENGDKALGLLLDKFVDSPRLKTLASSLAAPGIRNERALRQIIKTSSNIDNLGHATYSLASNLNRLKRYAVLPDDVKKQAGKMLGENGYEYLQKRTVEELDTASIEFLEICIVKYKDVKIQRETLGVVADNRLFGIKHLQIGKIAPDIKGMDLDEVAFKLSDYRGKVVILDFWGDW